MTVTSHINTLRRKHQELDRKIEVEQQSPGSNDLHIASLKKQKLQLKEEITRLVSAH